MKRVKQGERPYLIRYIRGERVLHDSATTLEAAQGKVAFRAAKPGNRGERAEVYSTAQLVYGTCY